MTIDAIVIFNEMDRHAEALKKVRYGVVDESYLKKELDEDRERGYLKWINGIDSGVIPKSVVVEAKAVIGLKILAEKLRESFMNE